MVEVQVIHRTMHLPPWKICVLPLATGCERFELPGDYRKRHWQNVLTCIGLTSAVWNEGEEARASTSSTDSP